MIENKKLNTKFVMVEKKLQELNRLLLPSTRVEESVDQILKLVESIKIEHNQSEQRDQYYQRQIDSLETKFQLLLGPVSLAPGALPPSPPFLSAASHTPSLSSIVLPFKLLQTIDDKKELTQEIKMISNNVKDDKNNNDKDDKNYGGEGGGAPEYFGGLDFVSVDNKIVTNEKPEHFQYLSQDSQSQEAFLYQEETTLFLDDG
jgi:hypothetical protein